MVVDTCTAADICSNLDFVDMLLAILEAQCPDLAKVLLGPIQTSGRVLAARKDNEDTRFYRFHSLFGFGFLGKGIPALCLEGELLTIGSNVQTTQLGASDVSDNLDIVEGFDAVLVS